MPEVPSLLSRLVRRAMGRRGHSRDEALLLLDKTLSRLNKKVDLLAKRNEDDRLILRRMALLVDQGATRDLDATETSHHIHPVRVAASAAEDWRELSRCPVCGCDSATLVCEYNRFLLAETAPDEGAKVYNYSLCHGCGVVYAARRPGGRRYRELLAGFHENLGRVGAASAWLNPGPLNDEQREQLRRRARQGVLVSEHADVSPGDWLPGAFRDRLLVATHVELLGSLLTLERPRVLEIRSRTGAILDALRRLYGASVYALPIFESQQEIVKGLYGIPADALVDFERFQIPYEGLFDLVVSNHMLTHALMPGDFLDRVSAALVPGGHLYLYNEMDEAEFLSETKSMFQTMNPFHMQILSPTSLVRALGARGFDVMFLAHTDRVHMVCLARKSSPVVSRIPEAERKRRLQQYRAARDVSILGLPDDRREIFAAEWASVVERAVLSGLATLDERGRPQFTGRRRPGRGAEPPDDSDL